MSASRPGAPKAALQGTSDGLPALPAPAVRSNGPRGPLPSPEQLLNLVHRAGAGRALTPDEAELLHSGVQHLLRQVVGAGATVRQLEAELYSVRLELAKFSPLVVSCRFCGAEAGQRCRSVRGQFPPRTPHTARLHAAARAGERR
jgi:hypothetical protein